MNWTKTGQKSTIKTGTAINGNYIEYKHILAKKEGNVLTNPTD